MVAGGVSVEARRGVAREGRRRAGAPCLGPAVHALHGALEGRAADPELVVRPHRAFEQVACRELDVLAGRPDGERPVLTGAGDLALLTAAGGVDRLVAHGGILGLVVREVQVVGEAVRSDVRDERPCRRTSAPRRLHTDGTLRCELRVVDRVPVGATTRSAVAPGNVHPTVFGPVPEGRIAAGAVGELAPAVPAERSGLLAVGPVRVVRIETGLVVRDARVGRGRGTRPVPVVRGESRSARRDRYERRDEHHDHHAHADDRDECDAALVVASTQRMEDPDHDEAPIRGSRG